MVAIVPKISSLRYNDSTVFSLNFKGKYTLWFAELSEFAVFNQEQMLNQEPELGFWHIVKSC